MPAYRLYRVDGAGKIQAAEWLEADDDDSAVAAAKQSAGEENCELWQRNRLVARLGGPHPHDRPSPRK